MTLSIPAPGPAPRVLSLIRFFESDAWGPGPGARMLTVINTDLEVGGRGSQLSLHKVVGVTWGFFQEKLRLLMSSLLSHEQF